MTENEAKKWLRAISATQRESNHTSSLEIRKEALYMAIQALEEIQQYRAYKEIFESHFSKEALELLSDKAEFGKWLERGKWIAKKCDEINRKLEGFEAIGTIDEFKALKEKSEPKKVIRLDDNDEYYDYQCPSCGAKEKFCLRHRYCSCGQLLEY